MYPDYSVTHVPGPYLGVTNRLMKKAHLQRWLRRSSLQRTAKYASLLASSPPCIWTFLISLHSERCFSASC